MSDPYWGEPARNEFNTITKETHTCVEIDKEIAQEMIKNGAQVLRILTVYEEKEKEGKTVRKVRLVADGRTHRPASSTYSPTPGREELLILLSIFAVNNWDYYFIDEARAFLKAPLQDQQVILAKFQGDPKMYRIMNALYGMKTASKDYNAVVTARMKACGFQPLLTTKCIYYLVDEDGHIVIVFDYVDDYLFGGNDNETTLRKLQEFRQLADNQTTEPVLNGPLLLGIEIERISGKKLILLRMTKRIIDLAERFPDAIVKKRNVPLPTSGYIVQPHELDKLSEVKKRPLNKKEAVEYMSIVGCLIWIQGIRFDIVFAVLYISWFSKAPLQHHMDMAKYCIGYLYSTKEYPLVLGGDAPIKTVSYTDASLATGPNGRSITAEIHKLNGQAGAIKAKAQASHVVPHSSWEAELMGTSNAFKSRAGIANFVNSLPIRWDPQGIVHGDNKAQIDFVKGEGSAKGVRHMEMRLWYIREEYMKGNVKLQHMPGTQLPADKLTKVGSAPAHSEFTREVLGLDLVSPEFLK